MKAQRNDETRPLPRTRRPFPPSPVAAVLTAICLVLAKSGHSVLVNYARNAEAAEAVVAEIAAHYAKC